MLFYLILIWGDIMLNKTIIISFISLLLFFIYGILASKTSLIICCTVSALLITLIWIISKKCCTLSDCTLSIYVVFIFLTVILGRGMNFYAQVFGWDKFLHFISGFIMVKTAGEIYLRVGGEKENLVLYNIFCLMFAISVAALWEIWEFSGDKLFKFNAQNNSLTDTMLDIILGSFSGIITVFIKNILGKNKNVL